MSQDEEQEITKLVEDSALARSQHVAGLQSPVSPTSPDEVADQPTPFTSPAMSHLTELGRFAEPALVRVRNVTNKPAIDVEAGRLLKELQATEK